MSYAALYDAPDSAYAQVRIAAKRLEELRRFDDGLGRIAELLKPAEIAIDEAAGELRDYVSRLEADPERLEEVENRLAAIDKLKRKYGGSVAEILAFRAWSDASATTTVSTPIRSSPSTSVTWTRCASPSSTMCPRLRR